MTLAEAPRVEVLPDPQRSEVTLDGPVGSEQSAVIRMDPARLEQLWQPSSLEVVAQAYWSHLHRLSLRTLAVDYDKSPLAVRAFGRIELLRFHEPRFETGADYGRVTWPIDRGILVAKRGRGQGELVIEVRRSDDPGEATVTSRVSNFYPWLRGTGPFARLGRLIYVQTQLRIHVFVTKRFLRSLERLDLGD